jgi:hypothetical protein
MRLIINLFFAILLCGCSEGEGPSLGGLQDSQLTAVEVVTDTGLQQEDAPGAEAGRSPGQADVGGGDATAVGPDTGEPGTEPNDVSESTAPDSEGLSDVPEPLEDTAPDTTADVELGDDTSGVVVVGDSSSGPVFSTPDTEDDAGALEGDASVGSADTEPSGDTGGVEGDIDEEPPEPSTACLPNPCQQGPAPTCQDGVAIASFAPGDCSAAPGGGVSCDYVAQGMDCAEAGGSCVAGLCAEAPPAPVEGELVITEVMRAPQVNKRQWLELYVAATEPRNLAGCGLMDGASNRVVFGSSPSIVQPGEFVLVAEVEPVNDGLPSPDVTIALGSLNLLAVDGPLLVNCMGNFVDLVDLPTGTDLMPFPSDTGIAMQVGPGNYASESNDTPESWCGAEDPYAFGAYGSPGEPNPSCNADIDRCRLWYPAFGSGGVGDVIEAMAIVFDEGITDTTLHAPDPSPGFLGELGLGPDGVSPELQPDAFSWFSGTPDYDPPTTVPPQDDMYGAWVIPSTAGTFDLAARFSPDAGTTWIYCDLDGSDNGYQLNKAGHVLVQP